MNIRLCKSVNITTTRPIGPRHGSGWSWAVRSAGLLIVVAGLGLALAHAQDQRKRKVPVVDKITGGSSRQAFSGKVEALDLERHVLEVNASEGKAMEIFPIKKGISVTSASGERMKLDQVKKGTNILIYYDVKGDKRTVKEIVILSAAADEDHKKTSPPS